MKQLLPCLIILCSVQFLFGQCEYNIEQLPSIDNYYRQVPILPGGLVWEESFFLEETQKRYSSSFSNSLWIAGFDSAGNVFQSSRTYFPNDPGPLDDNSGEVFVNACDYFDRLWIISSAEISLHKENYLQGILSQENTPKDILEWPAKGNMFFDIGEDNGSILDQDLAPFFDNNSDGVYNALDGDIPIYKAGVEFENFEDVWAPYIFSLNIVNDGGSANQFPLAERLSIEILQSSYLLNCPDSQELNYTVFYNFFATYKGDTELGDLRIGYWEDVDFGCYDNDLIGCYPSLNTAYIYNEETEEGSCFGNLEPINVNWGMSKNTILLSHEMKSYIYYNNSAVGIPNPATVDPSTGLQVYNLLGGTWLDGTPLTVGGTGFNPGSTEETLFAFPALPNDPNGWSMASVNLPGGDYRPLMGIKAQENLSPGENIIVDVASHVMMDPSSNHLNIIEKLEDRTQIVKDAFNTMQTNPQELNECSFTQNCIDDCVWPGNILPDDRVDGKDILLYGAIIGRDIQEGKDRDQRGGLWAPHMANNWNGEINEINIKHADGNGDGTLSESDIEVFEKNLRLTIPNSNQIQNDIASYDPEGFKITLDKEEINVNTSTVIGRLINISIGPRELESFDFAYHGLSFDIVFDTSKITSAGTLWFDINQEFFDETIYAEGFFDETSVGANVLPSFGDDRITVMATSSSGENQFPESLIVSHIALYALENGTTNNSNRIDTTQVSLENIVFMNAEGKILEEEVGYYTTDLILTGLEYVPELSSVVDKDLNRNFKVIPNPASTKINIQSQIPIDGDILILNLNGRIIDMKKVQSKSEIELNLTDYLPGLYIIKILDQKGRNVGTERFVVMD